MAPFAREFAEPLHYKLYGVLCDHGESAGSGHYNVDMLHPNEDSGNGEGWLHIDDEAVRAVGHEDVFGEHGNERVDDPVCLYAILLSYSYWDMMHDSLLAFTHTLEDVLSLL